MSKTDNYIILPDALVEDLAAKSDVRSYLNEPYLDKREKTPMLVATNGHLLAAAPVEIVGEVPQGPIPIEAIKRVRKAAQKTMSVGLTLYVDNDMCGTGKVMFERENLGCHYPEWRQIVPKMEKGIAPDICFDARYFQIMQAALAPGAKLGTAGTAVFLQRNKAGDVDTAAAFRVMCKKHDGVIGVIMPMRWD